jgi:hypothetical protein
LNKICNKNARSLRDFCLSPHSIIAVYKNKIRLAGFGAK